MNAAIDNVLDLKNVSKSFGGVCAVANVNLTLKNGESRVIIGPNGAGKTTLFNLITGEIPPDSGKIVLFGTDMTSAPVRKRSVIGVARTYQICNLFSNLTVQENVLLALDARKWKHGRVGTLMLGNWNDHRDTTDYLAGILDRVGLNGHEQRIVGNLSHGEQRQLELGIAIASEPRLILLDEPMAGLSKNERIVIGELVRELVRHRSILAIEHDMDFAMSLCDAITVMNFGSVIAEGSVDAIRANDQVRKIYKLHSETV